MLPGPVRIASQTIVLVTPCSGGAWIPSASASPAPVIVWHGRAVEGEQAEALGHVRMGDVEPERDARVAGRRRAERSRRTSRSARIWGRLNIGGLRSGSAVGVRERHPAAREPEVDRRAADAEQRRRPGAALASIPWQVEQFSTNRVRPLASSPQRSGCPRLVRLARSGCRRTGARREPSARAPPSRNTPTNVAETSSAKPGAARRQTAEEAVTTAGTGR